VRGQVWIEAIVVVLAIVLGSLIITSYFLDYVGGGSLIAQHLPHLALQKAEQEQSNFTPLSVRELRYSGGVVVQWG